jgi:hypothetical protein
MHCATFPRHLGRQVTRALIALQQADTVELARWAYGDHLPIYALHNVRRLCYERGIQAIGKRGRRYLWALHKPDE